MDPILIEAVDTAAADAEVGALARATVPQITTIGQHADALGLLKRIAAARKAVIDLFADAKDAAHRAHKAIVASEKRLLDPLDRARAEVSAACAAFEEAQRAIAREEQRRLEAAAREAEEDARLADALAAEACGERAEAEAILAEPVPVPVVAVAPAVARAAGVTTTHRWSAEVVDVLALVRYVAEHPEWIALVKPDTVALNRLAVTQQAAMKIPGVRAIATTSHAVRG